MQNASTNKKLKNIFINLSLLLTSLLIALLIVEAVLLLLGYQPYYSQLQPKTSSSDIAACNIETIEEAITQGIINGPLGTLKYDEVLGYTYDNGPHGFSDSKNFYDDYDDFKRVLVLGDSFTHGVGADAGNGFVDLLNQHYRKSGVIFFNTGIGGYGQNNQFAVLKKYFNIIKPDVVLLGFYAGNDFWDNLSPVDRYTAFPGHWVNNYEVILHENDVEVRRRRPLEIVNIYKRRIGCPPSAISGGSFVECVREKIAYQTRVGTQLWILQRSLKHKMMTSMGNKGRTTHELSEMANRDPRYLTTKRYFRQIQDFLDRKQIPFVVLVIPDLVESKNTLQKSRDYQYAITLFNELKIHYIDTFDKLDIRDYEDVKPGSKRPHWNNSGHRKLFNKIASHFGDQFEFENRERVKLQPGPGSMLVCWSRRPERPFTCQDKALENSSF